MIDPWEEKRITMLFMGLRVGAVNVSDGDDGDLRGIWGNVWSTMLT